ncbi:ATP synthase F0 sector subunit c [Enhygromyxa salina]|uniref:ATP synthase subunit c n=1 Tax=Enhygromyxa salina TaxID=215803 RepID=A0A0C2CTV0_9BACT|nr:ATP synthase F0 subunit C [Enhygromyxa salina]KIG14586.1 ATP synthase F0 sector subunit c [Enhygromyxa salina]
MRKQIVAPIAALVTFLFPILALAAPAAEGAAEAAPPANMGVAIAMALAIGLAALGGGLGQGRAAAAALEGICRNPNSSSAVFTPMLLGLAFIESLVIFALVIAFMLQGRL